MNVKTRQAIERRIARKVVQLAIKAGYSLNIDNGGEGFELSVPSNKASVVLAGMFATDEERLFLFKGEKWDGWVSLVYGNDGFDVMADYSISLDALLKPAYELARKLEDQYA